MCLRGYFGRHDQVPQGQKVRESVDRRNQCRCPRVARGGLLTCSLHRLFGLCLGCVEWMHGIAQKNSIVVTGFKHSICGGYSYYFYLVDAEIWPQIGPIDTYKLDTGASSMDTLGLPATCMCVGVGSCPVVKRKWCYRNFSVHVIFLVETVWRLRCR